VVSGSLHGPRRSCDGDTGSTTPTSDGARGMTVEAVRYTRQLSHALAQVFDAS
jgi:hypothetical protein